MESEVFERIRDYLADQLDIEAEKITPESDIINDFGADSLDVIDMSLPCLTSSGSRSRMRRSKISTPWAMWLPMWKSICSNAAWQHAVL